MKILPSDRLKQIFQLIRANFFRKDEGIEVESIGIDETPTKDSENLITSGGVYDVIPNVPVKGVQVAGMDLTPDSDGKVNVPIYSVGGISYDVVNGIQTNPAVESNINNRNATYKPICANSMLDYAVKVAMCDGRGAAWTPAEQKAARDRIGEGQFELIETITLTEDVYTISREQTPEGDAYNFKRARIVITLPSDSGNNRYVGFSANYLAQPNYNDQYVYSILSNFGHTTNYSGVAEVEVIGGILRGHARAANGTLANPATMFASRTTIFADSLKKLGIVCYSGTDPFPAGTIVEIYGVWA